MNKNIYIFTDGACTPNPGKGSYAYIIVNDNTEIHRHSDVIPYTTNNRMEVMAIIKALEYLTNPSRVIVFTDSKYAINMARHRTNINIDLRKELKRLCSIHTVSYEWIKAHNGIYYNEAVDTMCQEALWSSRIRQS